MDKPRKPKSATHKLMDYLARRDHSEAELRTKLSDKYSPEEIEKALQYARDNNWLAQPEQLSEKLAEQLHYKLKGFLYISQYLKKKGLPPVDKDEDLEYKKAMEFIEGKYQPSDMQNKDFKKREKASGKLARKLISRGFDPSTVWRVVSEVSR